MQGEMFRGAFKKKVAAGEGGRRHRVQTYRTAHCSANLSTSRTLRLPGLNDHFLIASAVALFSSAICELTTVAALTLPSGPISTCTVIVPTAPFLRSASE